jgi:hypothetical protein
MSEQSELLFARPSFLEGCARIGDFTNRMSEYNSLPTPALADRVATAADWDAVGSEMRNAILLLRDEIVASRKRT